VRAVGQSYGDEVIVGNGCFVSWRTQTDLIASCKTRRRAGGVDARLYTSRALKGKGRPPHERPPFTPLSPAGPDGATSGRLGAWRFPRRPIGRRGLVGWSSCSSPRRTLGLSGAARLVVDKGSAAAPPPSTRPSAILSAWPASWPWRPPGASTHQQAGRAGGRRPARHALPPCAHLDQGYFLEVNGRCSRG